MLLKKIIFISVFFIVILLTGCQHADNKKTLFTQTKQNSRIEYKNEKFFVDKDSYLCKWDQTMTNYSKLVPNVSESFTILDGSIYYKSSSDYSIMKCDIDGKQIEKVASDHGDWHYDIEAYKNYIFYTIYTNDDNKLYRLDTVNKEIKQITTDYTAQFHVMNNKIYYMKVVYDYDKPATYITLCQCDLDGGNETTLGENPLFFGYRDKDVLLYVCFSNQSKTAYYIPSGDEGEYDLKRYELGINGSDIKMYRDVSNKDVIYIAAFTYSDENSLYNTPYKLYAYNKNTKQADLINNDGVGYINGVKDNYIYYSIDDKKHNIKEVKSQLDGSNVQKVDENTLDAMFRNNYTNMEDYFILWP